MQRISVLSDFKTSSRVTTAIQTMEAKLFILELKHNTSLLTEQHSFSITGTAQIRLDIIAPTAVCKNNTNNFAGQFQSKMIGRCVIQLHHIKHIKAKYNKK